MEVSEFLAEHKAAIVGGAATALAGRHLRHYEDLGHEASTARLAALFDCVVDGARRKNLVPILVYAERVATERHETGFDFVEVQAAFNLLEEAIWRQMLAGYPQPELPTALGMVATLFGAAKDKLASTYLSLATEKHVPTLDLQSLFRGTQNTGGGANQP